MAKRPERVNPLVGVKERKIATMAIPQPLPPSQAMTKNATGRVLISEYNALKKWAEARGSSVNAVVGLLVRRLLKDAALQDKVTKTLLAAQEELTAARVARLLGDKKIRAKVRELLTEDERPANL